MASASDSSSDVAANQRPQHFTERQLTSVHKVGLSSGSQPYPGQQSSVVDVYSTVNKAGRFCCFLSLLLAADKFVTVVNLINNLDS